MPKVMVLQHSPFEPLGLLVSNLKHKKIRLRYVNFYRNPDERIQLKDYDGIVVLGGIMNPDDGKKFPHLNYEVELLAEAVDKTIPILGICLGSQLLNLALGGQCYRMEKAEFGWTKIYKTLKSNNSMFSLFDVPRCVFQWHQYACIPPNEVDIVLKNEQCVQAFCYKECFIGLQFHLEIDKKLHERWLKHPDYLTKLKTQLSSSEIESIRKKSIDSLPQSLTLANQFFDEFCSLFIKKEKHALKSMHAGR
jgi:GMP synthase (glutamine-hydrolysing)